MYIAIATHMFGEDAACTMSVSGEAQGNLKRYQRSAMRSSRNPVAGRSPSRMPAWQSQRSSSAGEWTGRTLRARVLHTSPASQNSSEIEMLLQVADAMVGKLGAGLRASPTKISPVGRLNDGERRKLWPWSGKTPLLGMEREPIWNLRHSPAHHLQDERDLKVTFRSLVGGIGHWRDVVP